MSKLDTVASQLLRLHDDLKFTSERVNTMEYLLNIHSTSPKQATILNSFANGETMEEDEDYITAGIDTTESTVFTQRSEIDTLKEENHYLKRNLQTNVEKLNEALKVVDSMQYLLINAGQLHESRKVRIELLERPLDFRNQEQDDSPNNTNNL